MAALAITPALAVDVTYNTTGTFSSTGTNVYSGADGLTITYGNTVGDQVSASGATNASFGTFTVVGPTCPNVTCNPGVTDPVSTNFALTVSQTVPSVGNETLSDTFAGTISANAVGDSSTVLLTFTGGSGTGGVPVLTTDPIDGHSAYSFNLGGVVYYIDRVTPIEPQTTNHGMSTINGAIDASAVPEPTFYGLTGTGFAGLLALAVWRRRQNENASTPAA